MRPCLVLAAVVAVAAAPAAIAQQATPEQAIAFLDGNSDGKVDADEYAKFQAQKLTRFDANTDGKLSMEEFVASVAPAEQRAAPQTFPTFDANKDSSLEAGEYAAYHAYVMRTFIDTDRDGYMSATELAAVQAPAAQPASTQTAAAATAGPAMLGAGAIDHNRDGKTDLNEYLNFQLPNLAKNDANQNGRLSRDEFKESLPPNAKGNAERAFVGFDRNKDKGLNQDEFLGYHAFVFNTLLDRNKDGFVDMEEWRKILSERS